MAVQHAPANPIYVQQSAAAATQAKDGQSQQLQDCLEQDVDE